MPILPLVSLVVVVVLSPVHARWVWAACDVIPSAVQAIRGSTGSVDRPFAGPGEWVELGPDSCTGETLPPPGDVAVTVAFTPLPAGLRRSST